MTHLILTGATGLVGSGVLAHMLPLTSPSGPISRLTILSRREVPMAEGKENVKVVRLSDFATYGDELMKELKGAEGCVWALGISVTQVGKRRLSKKITTDYPIAAAKAFSTLNDNFKFVYVSGEGATTTPGPLTSFFGRVKGLTERKLIDLGTATPSLSVYSVRPGMVDAVSHPEIAEAVKQRSVPKYQQFLLDGLGPVIRTVWPGGTSPTKDLGRYLTDLAMGDGKALEGPGVLEGRIVTNSGFRRLAEVGKH